MTDMSNTTFTADEMAVMESALRQQRGWERRFGKASTWEALRDDVRDHVFDAVCAVFGDPDLVEGDDFDAMVTHVCETHWSGRSL